MKIINECNHEWIYSDKMVSIKPKVYKKICILCCDEIEETYEDMLNSIKVQDEELNTLLQEALIAFMDGDLVILKETIQMIEKRSLKDNLYLIDLKRKLTLLVKK